MLKKKSRELDEKIKILSKGTCDKRRGALEVTRAISLTPFSGDITFNAKSGEKNSTSLYGTEVHATRYQYGFALTPHSLDTASRAFDVVNAVVSLSEVAGNHSRFLYDFSPDAVVFRWTEDFAPRMLYGFGSKAEQSLTMDDIKGRIELGDINASELVVGMATPSTLPVETVSFLKTNGAMVVGVKAAADEVNKRIQAAL